MPGARSQTMQSEELLAAVLREEPALWPPDWTRLDEDALVQAAELHGVAPLVAFLLDARRRRIGNDGHAETGWPARIVHALHEHAAQTAVLHALRMRELMAVLECLTAGNVRPVLTKGVVLAHTHYPEPPLRPSFDIDLYVAEDDIGVVARVFEDRGYRRSRQVAGRMVMPQFDYEKKCEHGAWHIYDVHFRPVNPHVFAEALPFKEVSAEAVDISPLGPLARGTSATHAALLACLHRVAHHPGEDRLIWLYDLHLLAERLDEQQWERLVRLGTDKKVGTPRLSDEASRRCDRRARTAFARGRRALANLHRRTQQDRCAALRSQRGPAMAGSRTPGRSTRVPVQHLHDGSVRRAFPGPAAGALHPPARHWRLAMAAELTV
ncbi:MAG: hypothetical protein DMF90_26505 [Acidobacteria bacterium]|nr:MAG: hypothetical protein DMF90_26505 [Acidobacteriota bacterium]